MQKEMTKLEMGVGLFAASVDGFIERVGMAPAIEDESLRMLNVSMLVEQADALRGAAGLLVDLSKMLERKQPESTTVAQRCAKLLNNMDSVRTRFESACQTLEHTRRMVLDGMN